MSRTFEDRRREKKEQEQRQQVRKERLDAARRAAIEEERTQARDSAQREAARKEQLAEQARLDALAARRAQARVELASQLQQQILSVASVVRQKQESRKQGISALRQARISAGQDRALQTQQKKEARQALAQEQRRIESAASAASAPPQPEPSQPKPKRPEPPKPDRKQLTKAAAAEQIRQQTKKQAQALQAREERQKAQRIARKELLTQQATQATPPSPEGPDKLRREQLSAVRAAQLREAQKKAIAKELRDEQRRAQEKQEAANARKAAERKAAAAEPVRKEAPPPARPLAAKLADRRLARKRALAAAAVQPLPEEPLDSFPWLKTKGSFLVDELQNAVYLRGVTCRGFDDMSAAVGRTFPEALSLDEPNLSTMTDLWGINIVRIPFQAATVLSGNSSFLADQMLAGLDDVVGAVTTANARVLLCMEASGSAPDTTAGSDIFRAWSLLANHYQDEPGVLYELFSSPQPLPGNWLEIAAMLVGTIRLQNPASLIFVSNGKGGADISGLPIRFSTGDPVFNVVYTMEASDTLVPDPDDAQLRAFAASYPLFASPWSDSNPNADRSSEGTGNLFARYGMGWIAANWNAEPRLVRSSMDHDFAPTRWGYVAQRALAQPVKPLLPSVRLEDETASAWRLP